MENKYIISESALLELLDCQNLLGAYMQVVDLDYDILEEFLEEETLSEDLPNLYKEFDNQPKGN